MEMLSDSEKAIYRAAQLAGVAAENMLQSCFEASCSDSSDKTLYG